MSTSFVYRTAARMINSFTGVPVFDYTGPIPESAI